MCRFTIVVCGRNWSLLAWMQKCSNDTRDHLSQGGCGWNPLCCFFVIGPRSIFAAVACAAGALSLPFDRPLALASAAGRPCTLRLSSALALAPAPGGPLCGFGPFRCAGLQSEPVFHAFGSFLPYMRMACIVMAYVVMACVVMVPFGLFIP